MAKGLSACSQGSWITLEGVTVLQQNIANGAGTGCYALTCGGGAVVLYDNSSLTVSAGVKMRLNRHQPAFLDTHIHKSARVEIVRAQRVWRK